jgi:hypothetical protein
LLGLREFQCSVVVLNISDIAERDLPQRNHDTNKVGLSPLKSHRDSVWGIFRPMSYTAKPSPFRIERRRHVGKRNRTRKRQGYEPATPSRFPRVFARAHPGINPLAANPRSISAKATGHWLSAGVGVVLGVVLEKITGSP